MQKNIVRAIMGLMLLAGIIFSSVSAQAILLPIGPTPSASNIAVLDSLSATNPNNSGAVAVNNFSYKEGLNFGSNLSVVNIDNTVKSLKIKANAKTIYSNTGYGYIPSNYTYAFVWSDSTQNSQKYNASAVASLLKYPSFTPSSEFTLQIDTPNNYYYNKYITVLAFVRNNDNKSELIYSGMPGGIEVDDVIPLYFYILPKTNVPQNIPTLPVPMVDFKPKLDVSGQLLSVTNLDSDPFVDEYRFTVKGTVSGATKVGKLNVYFSTVNYEGQPDYTKIWKSTTCEVNNNTGICNLTVPNLQNGATYFYQVTATNINSSAAAAWSEMKKVVIPKISANATKNNYTNKENIQVTANVETNEAKTVKTIVVQIWNVLSNKLLDAKTCYGNLSSCTFISNKPFEHDLTYRAFVVFTDNTSLDTAFQKINIQTVNSDTIAPTVNASAKVVWGNTQFLNKTLEITATAQDAGGPVQKVEIFAYKAGQSNNTLVKTCPNLSPVGKCVVSLPQSKDGGIYSYYAKATDKSGNISVTQVKSYFVPIL